MLRKLNVGGASTTDFAWVGHRSVTDWTIASTCQYSLDACQPER